MATIATVHSDALPAGRTPAVQLVVVEGPDAGRAARVNEACTVGSERECDLVLTDDRVSRRHLRVEASGGSFRVVDLGSRNGTFYEGSRVAEAVVPAGATLKVGRSYLRLSPLPEPLEIAPSQERSFGELAGESLAMREVFAVLELAAKSDVTILLEGETGTGKELAARGLHDASGRRKNAFVAVDCAALPAGLVESELFGHVRGAFTGASHKRDGAFVRAGSGTLLLDELDSIPPETQSKLLRVIEERRVRAVGSDVEREVDVRVIGASRRDLSSLVAEGAFRSDLYYRLSVIRVRIPPLRSRREDIAPIVAAILRRRGIDPGPIGGPKLDALYAHDWPGNARELRNVIDRALALGPGARSFADLRIGSLGGARDAGDPLRVRTELPYAEAKDQLLEAFERMYLTDLLARSDGNLSAASRAAQLDRKHLRRLARRHGLIAEGPIEGSGSGSGSDDQDEGE